MDRHIPRVRPGDTEARAAIQRELDKRAYQEYAAEYVNKFTKDLLNRTPLGRLEPYEAEFKLGELASRLFDRGMLHQFGAEAPSFLDTLVVRANQMYRRIDDDEIPF